MKKNDGGPAYPYKVEHFIKGQNVYPGMSLRDYLAGQALSGMLSNASLVDALIKAMKGDNQTLDEFPKELTDKAYSMADACLKEREKNV